MLKFLLLAVLIYIVYKLFARDFLKKKEESAKEEQAEQDKRIAAGEMVKDPECGVYVALDDSISVRNGSQTYHFCSYECRDKFLKKLETGGASAKIN